MGLVREDGTPKPALETPPDLLEALAANEAARATFEELGVTHSEVKSRTTGTAMITLRDPDNIQIEIFGGPVDPSIAGGR